MIMRKLILFVYFLLPLIALGDSARKLSSKESAEIVKKLGDWYLNTAAYTMDIEIKTFKSLDLKTPHEIQYGFNRKSGKCFHSFMMGTHTVQNDKFQITIDSARNFMSVKEAANNIWEPISLTILEKYMKSGGDVLLTELPNDEFRLKIIPPVASSLDLYELIYDKNYRIKEIKMQLEKEDFDEDGKTRIMINPVVVFRFYNYSAGKNMAMSQFQNETYIKVTGNKITPQSNYASYEFFDLRVNEKK